MYDNSKRYKLIGGVADGETYIFETHWTVGRHRGLMRVPFWFPIFSMVVFSVAEGLCWLRGGHIWGETHAIKDHRERYCVRCDKVQHWIVGGMDAPESS